MGFPEGILRDLLARLHGDGGHRQMAEKVTSEGLVAACHAAITELHSKLEAESNRFRDMVVIAGPTAIPEPTAERADPSADTDINLLSLLDQIDSDLRAGSLGRAGHGTLDVLRILCGTNK